MAGVRSKSRGGAGVFLHSATALTGEGVLLNCQSGARAIHMTQTHQDPKEMIQL